MNVLAPQPGKILENPSRDGDAAAYSTREEATMKRKIFLAALILTVGAALSAAQTPPPVPPQAPADLRPLLAVRPMGLALIRSWYAADRDLLSRFYHVASPSRFARLKRFDLDWAAALEALPVGDLDPESRKDRAALLGEIKGASKKIDLEAAAAARIRPLVPFLPEIAALEEARMRLETMDAEKSALLLAAAIDKVSVVKAALEGALADPARLAGLVSDKDLAGRGGDAVKDLRRTLQEWFDFYNDFDPLFTWWMAQPYQQASRDLEEYESFLKNRLAAALPDGPSPEAGALEIAAAPAPPYDEVPDLKMLLAFPQDEMRNVLQQYRGGRGGRGGAGRGGTPPPAPGRDYYAGWLKALKALEFNRLSRPGQVSWLSLRNTLEVQLRRLEQPVPPATPRQPDASGIPGQPVGREALMLALAEELIPYTPEELIALGEREFAWCEAEMKKASREMGLGDDWKKAVEKVKDQHVPPGGQPDLVRDLIFQGADYLREHDLITVPEVERETLRMEMMSPERQLVNPFFTGGALISVSYPAGVMTTRQKIESMRGNNIPFSHAVAFHEMIPGHNMQGYVQARFAAARGRAGGSSFWGEGWPVYWETILYDRGFDDTPELRVGALFWRLHRCARIVFSLKFHMGRWSPQECIDYLVDTVGHERQNATAEVRRSFGGDYGPLYQAAYLVGALQLRALRGEVVGGGKMSEKAFHDAVIRLGSMPVALLRLLLGDRKMTPEMSLEWKCFGPDPGRER
jgi:hypothetical protein